MNSALNNPKRMRGSLPLRWPNSCPRDAYDFRFVKLYKQTSGYEDYASAGAGTGSGGVGNHGV